MIHQPFVFKKGTDMTVQSIQITFNDQRLKLNNTNKVYAGNSPFILSLVPAGKWKTLPYYEACLYRYGKEKHFIQFNEHNLLTVPESLLERPGHIHLVIVARDKAKADEASQVLTSSDEIIVVKPALVVNTSKE